MEKVDLIYKAMFKTVVWCIFAGIAGLLSQSMLVTITIIATQALYSTFLAAELIILQTQALAILHIQVLKDLNNVKDD